MDSVKNQRGGPRDGAGRKTTSGTEEVMKPRAIRMTDAEWMKLLALGGSQWIRDKIRKARLSAMKGSGENKE